MDLRTLRYFTTLAELLSFSAAAEQLGLSQPAVSRQIQLMEAELNLKLFDRVGRKVFLTSAGRELLDHCYEIQRGLDSLLSRAAGLASGEQGVLRIGATPQTLESLISAILPRFQRKHPEVQMSLVEDGSTNLVRAVERGDVDVAVGALGRERFVRSRPLFPLVVLAAVPDGHPLSKRASVEMSEIQSERVMLLRKDFMTRKLFDGACQVAHVQPRVLIESASPHCLLALVQSGLGVAIIPSTVRLPKGHVPTIPLTHQQSQLGVWMHAFWDARRFTQPVVRSFIDELSAYTDKQYPGKSFRIARRLKSTVPLTASDPTLPSVDKIAGDAG
ncbi:MAG: LysR family transcriptional regulator [Burkholderiales bacterium]|nr:LysR family transcriptional regulator [Burkholderiales bacterium]